MTSRSVHIKDYLCNLFALEDPVLLEAKENARAEGLPPIEVPASVGKLLYCLAKIQRASRVLEIGTLGAYSTLWLARALPKEGRLISLEIDPLHASVARKNVALGGFEEQVEVREGVAREILDQMIASDEAAFDLIFIDADKENYPIYLEKSLQLARDGALILSDNLIPKGDEIDSYHPNNNIAKNIYQFNRIISSHLQLESILTTTIVGNEGRIDALGISIVTKS